MEFCTVSSYVVSAMLNRFKSRLDTSRR